MTIAALVAESLQLLWPERCTACEHVVDERSIFCTACTPSLTPLLGACPGCALPRDAGPGGRGCSTCRRLPFSFAEARAGYEYGASLADALVRMKNGQRHRARRLGVLLVPALVEALARGGFGPADVMAPVPLHPTRLRARGFNQALELLRGALHDVGRTPVYARALARGVPSLDRTLLLRTRATKPLGFSGPGARIAELAGAFAVTDPERVRYRRVLLVDDVFTTGATFNECAETLLRAGARAVHVVALARAV